MAHDDSLFNYKSSIQLECNSDIIFSDVFSSLYKTRTIQHGQKYEWKQKIDHWYNSTMNNQLLNNNFVLSSNLFENASMFSLAVYYIEKGINSAAAKTNYLIKGELLNKLAQIFANKGRYNEDESSYYSAIKYWEDAIALMKANRNEHNLIIYNGNIAQAYIKTSQFQKAKPLLIEGIQYFNDILEGKRNGYLPSADDKLCGYTFALAVCYRTEGIDLNTSEVYYKKAIELSERYGKLRTLELSYYGIGLLKRNLGKLEEAINYFRHAFDIAKKLSLQDRCVDDFNKLCNLIYLKSGFDTAQQFWNTEFELMNKIAAPVPSLASIIMHRKKNV